MTILPPIPALVAAARRYVPAPIVSYVQGVAPGVPADAMGNAAYDPASRTVYYQGRLDRFARAHEAGHALDQQALTDRDRLAFEQIMGFGKGRWMQGTGLHGGLRSPSEWFADYYSAAANHINPRRESEAAYATITPRRLDRFEAALARLGRAQGLREYVR